MIDIDIEKDIDLIKIFGKDKIQKYNKKYSILSNKDVLSWIKNKINKYTNKGKEENKFSLTSYVNALQIYCNYNKVENPSDLLTEEIDKRNGRVKRYLMFLMNAKSEEEIQEIIKIGFKKKPSEVSVRNLVQSRIKSFYSDRGSSVSFGLDTAKSGQNKHEIYLTRSIIKKIKAKFESPEYRLICKFQTQLGLRISDVLEGLTSGKYLIERFKEHYFIRNFRTQKMGIVINYMFLTEELTSLIQSIYGAEDLTQLDLTTIMKTKKGTTISKTDYLNRMKIVAKDIGITGNVKTHSFRKYFSSQVRKCKEVDDEFKEHLMGHSSYNLSQSYNNNLKDIEWVYEEWSKLETLICVDCIVYDRTSKEIINLKAQYKELIKKNIKKDKENLNLKEQVDKLTKAYESMGEKFEKLFKQLEDE